MQNRVTHLHIDDIPVLEVVAKERAEEALPLIIFYHGWQIDKGMVLTQGRKLAAKGFRVCLPDAPNHGERHQDVSAIPSLTFWNSIQGNLFEYEKIRDYFLQERNCINQIGVGGVSMGGMTTCALLTHQPEIKAAACVMGTPSPGNFIATTIKRMKDFNKLLPSGYLDLLSWTEAYDLAKHSELLAGRPIFFWHGTEDWKIPIESVVDFAEENREEGFGKHISLHIGVGERHLMKVPTMDKVSEFFLENM